MESLVNDNMANQIDLNFDDVYQYLGGMGEKDNIGFNASALSVCAICDLTETFCTIFRMLLL